MRFIVIFVAIHLKLFYHFFTLIVCNAKTLCLGANAYMQCKKEDWHLIESQPSFLWSI